MTQAYENVMEMKSIEVEEIEESEVQAPMENEVDELLGDLNPRFFEEAISMNEAKDQIYSAKAYSNYSFNTYGF
ncbi:MAG: hypothetical protein KGD65_04640 [Candidatus Lokiarchaeota archaeon]|nr:hypothetical protein [Candidatus Lokiarchaeota archaeon]